MNTHRTAWKHRTLNLMIALTGVGLVILSGKLIHSKLTTGSYSLFCDKTRRQRDVENIETTINQLAAPAA